MHSQNILHRDLKCANILVDNDGTIKLSDFGAAKKLDIVPKNLLKGEKNFSEEIFCNSLKGSPYWMAPEVVRRIGYSLEADIWSVGCVLIEMLTGVPPWSDHSKDAK